ncbi:MAG TPA: hypothetical protein IAB12_04330 [Candidatus Ornithospirochaeta avicola]|uniref:Uncharacterized protein n=1 Tax=Candidatus Ornithospirochaeta avicola TaxID=2840896 RepID=A0A9D1PSY3_9SPIO|nr:hypothetical protein [Candidatus Ornithospirochaeta avicola]
MVSEKNFENYLMLLTRIYDKRKVLQQRENSVLKILFYTPFYAKAKNPERVALVNMCNYFLYSSKITKDIFHHNEYDDDELFIRISLLYNIPDGDELIIEKGKLVLELIMLQDHFADMEADLQNAKYNPILSGKWDYYELRKRIISRIDSIKSAEYDAAISIRDAFEQNFWMV